MEFMMTINCDEYVHAYKTKLETARMWESAQDTNGTISPWVQGNLLGKRPL